MSEPSDQLLPFSRFGDLPFFLVLNLWTSSNLVDYFLLRSELVIIFLKFLYDQDPVGTLLQDNEFDHYIEVDL